MKVTPTERSVQKPSPENGALATLRGLLHARGIGAPSVALAVVAGMLLCAPGALAAGPPIFIHSSFHQDDFPTRVGILGEVDTEVLATELTVEYRKAGSSGAWIEVNKESLPAGGGKESNPVAHIGAQEPVYELGSQRGSRPYWLRRLTPDTPYEARFLAKNADSPGGVPTEEVVPFKTAPIALPEVDKTEIERVTFNNEGEPSFIRDELTDTTTSFLATIEGNGAETKYSFEYAPAEADGGRPAEKSAVWKPFGTSGATGTVSEAEEHAVIGAGLSGLVPEVTYYVRIKMSNSQGETVQATYGHQYRGQLSSFTTGAARPITFEPQVRNRTTESARVTDHIAPHGVETRWRFEYAESMLGPWNMVPGGAGEGTISQAQAEAKPYRFAGFGVAATLTGLVPAKKYYVRLFTENTAGEGKTCNALNGTDGGEEEVSQFCELVSGQSQNFGIFETLGPPSVSTFAIHSLVGEALQLDGGVDPKSTPTSAEQTITVEGAPTGGTFTLKFDGHESEPIAYDAPIGGEAPGSVNDALHEIGAEESEVEGPAGGPYTVFFGGADAGVVEPQIEANGSGLTPSSGKVTVHTVYKGGESSETRYRFQYVSQASFAEHGWADARETPEATVPPNGELEVVSALLPVLTAGETYHYRILGSSNTPGIGVVEGSEQTLTVPVSPRAAPEASCPNEAFRTGLSAHLPDCRAYEQLSPVEKHGSQEPFQYKLGLGSVFNVGEDGEHAVLEAPSVSYDVGAGAGGSPYLFSRAAGQGWGTTIGSPQPQTGLENVSPQLYSANVTQVAFAASYASSALSESADWEYKVGPVGGPYVTVASIPDGLVNGEEGWVAANGSFSKLVFETHDHELLGEPTGTRSGSDLYEYTVQGGLRQLNVSGEAGEPGVTIGTCGAVIGGDGSISADGSRVFFDAGCNGGDLYMRVDGSETVKIGAYGLVRANAQGTILLLQNGAGEMFDYDSETGVATPFSRSAGELAAEHATERELAALGIPDEKTIEVGEGSQPFSFSHPRYTYWGSPSVSASEDSPDYMGQAYRYDSVEHLVQCISCASPSDPNPKQPAFMSSGVGTGSSESGGLHGGGQGGNLFHFGSANGKFAFFTTPSALVPQDVDGEYAIEDCRNNAGKFECRGGVSGGEYFHVVVGGGEYWDLYGATSVSSDIYEWRAGGVDGCARLTGCLALITNGRGGYMNLLLGTADEGRDVYFYTRSTMVAQTGRPEGSLGEANIYDARIDGGFAPVPPRPTECEGDACSSPPSPPNDQTPSSLTFSGAGNVAPVPPTKAGVKSKKPKKKVKRAARKGRSRRRGKKAGRVAGDRRAR
jgi:hypothetical protein